MSKLGDAGIGIGTGIVDSALGQGMGLIFGKQQDRRQLEQAKKLAELQAQKNKEMADYNQKLGLDMFEKTGYGAKVKQMEDAGINVGLAMMQGGGGGSTAGAGAAAPVSGQSAGDPNAGVGMGIQMASQIALMKAQKENIEADTENKKNEAVGRGSENIGKEVDARNKVATEAEQRDQILGNAKKAAAEGVIAELTQQDIVNRMKSEAVGAALDNDLTKANIKLTRSKINQIEESISQEWRRLALEGRKVTVAELQQAVNETLGRKGINLAEEGLDEVKQQNMINNIMGVAGGLKSRGGTTRTITEDNKGNWKDTRTERKY